MLSVVRGLHFFFLAPQLITLTEHTTHPTYTRKKGRDAPTSLSKSSQRKKSIQLADLDEEIRQDTDDDLESDQLPLEEVSLGEEERLLQAYQALLDTDELLQFLKLGKTKLSQLINREGLPVHKFGKVYRFDRNEVWHWLQQRRISL